MHYKNGREAKNGDKIVWLSWTGPISGILYDATAGNNHCNGKLAPFTANLQPNLAECLHLDDVLGAVKKDEACKPASV